MSPVGLVHPAPEHNMLTARVFVLGVIVLLPLIISRPARGDDLRSLRDDVRGSNFDEKQKKKREQKKRDDGHHHHHDHDGPFSELSGSILLIGLSSPFWGPAAALNDDYELEAEFPEFPYEDVPGSLVLDSRRPSEVSDWTGRFRAEYANSIARKPCCQQKPTKTPCFID